MSDTTIVIAAGGYGTRLGDGPPKSLLRHRHGTYLRTVLMSVSRIESSATVVYCNRRDYIDCVLDVTREFESVTVVADTGVESTIELAQDAMRARNSARILFLYGHAPRPPAHMDAVMTQTAPLVVSCCEQTSKRSPIAWSTGKFAEPPYLVDRQLLLASGSNTWRECLKAFESQAATIPMNGPGEFNDGNEALVYRYYVEEWSRDLG